MSEKIRAAGLFLTEQAVVKGDLLENVVLLGPVSTNGNEYSAEALRSAVPHLKDRAVYVDHDLKSKARRMHERFGQTLGETVRFVESDYDGKPRVRGSIRFLQSHPLAPSVKEACEKGLGFFGCSFVADGVGRKDGKKRFVEQITQVHSLDIVDRAATGTLVEQEDEQPMSADPAQHAQEGLIKMITSIVLGEGTPTDKGAKITALLETMEGAGPAAPPPVPGGEVPGEEPPMSEQRLLAKIGELIEQKVTQALPALVEQGVKDRLANNRYVRPQGSSDALPARKPTEQIPTDPKAKADWLRRQ